MNLPLLFESNKENRWLRTPSARVVMWSYGKLRPMRATIAGAREWASRSSVFRKILETQAKDKAVAVLKERYHLAIHGPTKEGNAVKFNADKGKTQMEIHIDSNVSASVLRAIIYFLYTAQIQFTDKVTPLAAMTFAHEYDIQWLKKVCETELAKSITTKNLSELFQLSYRLKAEYLKTAARKFFEEHPEDHYVVLDALLSSTS